MGWIQNHRVLRQRAIAQAVLKKHWPDMPRHKDIREIRGDLYAGVTLLTGGFPCQPFSVAGKQRGKGDDRYLWPEMLRVIREARPAWIIGENVAGIVNMALDQVHTDLEAEGYEVESLIIPACGVDAPHRRDRVWIVANTKRGRCGESREQGGMAEIQKQRANKSVQTSEHGADVADSQSKQSPSEYYGGKQEKTCKPEQGEFRGNGCRELRECNWPTEPRLGRVAHGIPNRAHRLKGLGNAIVPQVAYQIIKGIRELL